MSDLSTHVKRWPAADCFTTGRWLRMISLRPPKRVLEQRGPSPRTAVDARIDGDDVNLVTTSASGELQNHPEAQNKLPWVGRLQNFEPLTSQRTFRKLNPTHGGSAQTLSYSRGPSARGFFFFSFPADLIG